MPTNNVQLLRGTSDAYANLETKNSNAIYFLTDSQRIYIGDTEYSRPIFYGTDEPSATMAPGTLYIREITENNIIRQQLYFSNGVTWSTVNVEPGNILAESITVGNNGDITPSATTTIFKVPTITVDTKGRVSNTIERTIDLVNFMPKSGGTFTGDVVFNSTLETTSNIHLYRDTQRNIPAIDWDANPGDLYIDAASVNISSPVTMTGASTISATPTVNNSIVNKKYVDDKITEVLQAASSAMVFKGTIGTDGTYSHVTSIDFQSAQIGDTYKIISNELLGHNESADHNQHLMKAGDLLVYTGNNAFTYVPSGDEDVTSIKIAGYGDTINVSTTAQTGNIVLGAAATKKVTTGANNMTMNMWTGAGNDKVPTDLAVKKLVDLSINTVMPKTGGTFTGKVTMNADFIAQDEITIASTDTQENLVNNQQHSNTKLIFDNANPVSGATPASIEGYYNAAVYSTHAYDDSTIKINATKFEAGGLTVTEAGGTGYGTGSDITTGMVLLNTNEIDLTATRQTASDAIGIIGEVHDKTNLTFVNTGWYSNTNETKSYIEGYYSFKEYDDEDNTNNVDTAHLDLIADEIKLDGDVKVTNALTTKTLTINSEDSTNITTSNQIHDISTLTFANNNQVNDNDKLATIAAQYSANVVGGGMHVADWSTLKLQADTVQLADLAIGGIDIGSAQTVTLSPQHDIPADREQKVDSESIIMRYNVAQHEGQNDSTDIVLNASNIIAQGPITLPNDPTQANHAVNKAYVDTALSNMTDTKITTVTTTGEGNVVTNGSVSNDGTILTLTKGESFVPADGGTFSGDVAIEGTLDVNNINNLIVEKREAYENYTAIRGTRLSSIIPSDNNNLYTSPTIDMTWNQGGGGATFTKLSLNATDNTGYIELNAGMVINANAPLILSRTPEGVREAATKGYVDNAISSAAMTWGTF